MNTLTVYLIMQASTLWGVLLAFALVGCTVKLFCAIAAAVNVHKAFSDKTEAAQEAAEAADYQRRAEKTEAGGIRDYYCGRMEEIKSKASVATEKLKNAEEAAARHNFRSLSKFALVMTVVLGFLPDTKTLCIAYVVPTLANSQAIQKDFPELYDLAISKLKEQLGAPVEKK